MKYTLRELRARHKLTQKEVAEKLGIRQSTYCAIESVDAEMIAKLAEILQVNKADISLYE